MNSPNSPSPLLPLGSILEQKNKSRSRVRLAFFCVVGVHVAGLMVLLMQGCKREQPVTSTETPLPPITESNLPSVENQPPPVEVASNVPPVAPPHGAEQLIPPALGGGQEYAIQKGDSFYTIAKKFGVTQKAIQDANPTKDPLKLKVGEKIVVPAPTATPPTPSGATATAVDTGEKTYVVKSGDNLSKIAKQFGTTVKAIEAANGLSNTRITVGQKLKIPVKASAPPTAPPPTTP